MDQLHLVALGRVEEGDDGSAAGPGRPVAQRVAFFRQLRRECRQIVDREGQVHQVGLHLHRGAVRQLAQLDFLVAVGRLQKRELRAARRGVAADDLQTQGLLVKLHGALEIVHPHAGVQEFFDHRTAA